MWKNKKEKIIEFISNLFHREDDNLDIEQPDIDWAEFAKNRPKTEGVNMYDKEERVKYVRGCLEQISEAAIQIEQMTFEYNMVTSYLTDMEEIERLPENVANEISDAAKKVLHLEAEHKNYHGKKNRLTEAQYKKIERIEEDMPQAYDKISESEVYQGKIRQDLVRLEGERHAYLYRKKEVETGIANSKGMITICMGAFAVCIIMLVLLKAMFEMDIQIGYTISIATAAITLTIIFLKNLDYRKELKRVMIGMNQLILLQNKVKIRYVNNTNLLEYYCVKYDVSSGKELNSLWEKYQEEKAERVRLERTDADLSFYQTQLLTLLRQYRVKDAGVWLHQAEALIDQREMVEIRHGLINRRQKLRKQLGYNQAIAQENQNEVKKLVAIYPQFAEEIVSLVSEYENQYAY